MIMAYKQWKTLQGELDKYGQVLIPVNSNLVDLIWDYQPSIPSNIVVPLELNYTGKKLFIQKTHILLRKYSENNKDNIRRL